MRNSRFVLVIFVSLGFAVSLAVPPEDVPETAYDESEGVPCEGTPEFSIEVPRASARITKADLEASCDFLLRFNHSTRRCNGRREDTARSHRVSTSFTILNHSLRR